MLNKQFYRYSLESNEPFFFGIGIYLKPFLSKVLNSFLWGLNPIPKELKIISYFYF